MLAKWWQTPAYVYHEHEHVIETCCNVYSTLHLKNITATRDSISELCINIRYSIPVFLRNYSGAAFPTPIVLVVVRVRNYRHWTLASFELIWVSISWFEFLEINWVMLSRQRLASGKKKAHEHKLFGPACPRDDPGFVPVTNPLCPCDKPRFSPYLTQWKPSLS